MQAHETIFAVTNARLSGAAVDLLVKDGRIESVSPSGALAIPSSVFREDAGGKILFPSFIDAHAHMREPGFEWKEDIASGLSAAAAGGFGAVLCMANTKPVNDKAAVTRFILDQAAQAHPGGPRLYPVGALTVGLEGTELAPMRELSDAGCVAFSDDGRPVASAEIFRRGVEYAAMWGKPVIDHCEDPFLAKGCHMNEGEVSGLIGVKGEPTVAEALHVARAVLLAEYLRISIHLAHISCRQSVELIAWAKSRGVPVTAETCPHYLFFDESAMRGYNSAIKVSPPLRTQEDIKAVREALADGTIDILSTDHAPHAPHEKENPLDLAPNGIIGLETALPLCYDLVRSNALSEQRLVAALSSGPAGIFGLPVNTFTPGDPADFILFDPQAAWKVTPETLKSKSCNTPLLGETVQGRVTGHWIAGNAIL